MTTLTEAANFGFSNDEVNAEALRVQNTAKTFGFSDAEIKQEEGINNSNWVRTVANVNKPTLSTITDRLDSGYSPYVDVGGRKGRFNFDVPRREDDKTPGVQYQFEGEDGNNSWFQLENDYQGGRWDEADNAEQNYNEYKTWGTETRKELLNQMWAGSPDVAEFIDKSVAEGAPWEDVQAGLQKFNTYRQESNFDVTGKAPIDEKLIAMLEDKELMESFKKSGLANMPELVIPDDATQETRTAMQTMQNYIKLAKASPEDLKKEWEWADVPGIGYDSSVIGLLHELVKVKNGDQDAAKNAAEMWINIQAYENQPWLKQRAFNITAIGNELPIMIPAGMAGAWACAGPAAAASAAATPVAGAAVVGGCSMGAAFGTPAFLRTLLTDLMEQDIGVVDETGMMDILLNAMEHGGIEAVVGIVTGVTGGTVGYGMKALNAGKFVTGGSTLVAETTAMVGTSGALHGYMPTWNNFLDTAVELLVLRGGNKGIKSTTDLIKRKYQGTEYYVYRNLQKLYSKSGIDPRAVKDHIAKNPELARELVETLGKKNYVMPEYYVRHVAEVMNRLEQVSRSTIKVGEQDFQVSRYYDAKKGEMEVLSQFLGEAKGVPDKITFKLTEDGNWTIKDMEGDLSIKGIQAIADFAESKGRQIVRTEGFDKAYEMMEMRQDKVETLDSRDQAAVDIMEGVKATADELRALDKNKEADEVMLEGRNLLEQAVGKDYLVQAEAKVKEFDKFSADKATKDAIDAEYRATGFHPPEVVFADTFGKIDKLDVPKHDIETELIVTHATASSNVQSISGKGFDVTKGGGFLHVGSDAQAKGRAAGITDPTYIRTQVKYNRPLDLRQFKDFDERTDGLSDVMATATFLNKLSRENESHPAKLTDKEFDLIRLEQGVYLQSLKLAEILQQKGREYDAIIYKNQVEAKGDSIAIMNNANIRALGYAKSTVSFEKSTDPLTKLAKEFETAEEFIQGLHNRDFKYVSGDKVDRLGFAKTQLARNPIESQWSLSRSHKGEIKQALEELGVVWSKTQGEFVRPPKDIDVFLDKVTENTTTLGKVKIPKLVKVSEKELTKIFEDSRSEKLSDEEGFNFTGAPEAKVTPKGQASDGGYNLSLIEGSVQANKIMNMPALVEIVRLLMDGKLPGIYKNLGQGTQGLFSHRPGQGKESGEIKLRADIFKDPQQAAKTVAHEIGHMVDWLEGTQNYTMSRGNILGRLAGLKKYLNTYMEGRPGGKKPLTTKEKATMRRDAEKFIKEEVQSISEVPEIKELGITPQQIKDIFTGVMKRADVDPRIFQLISDAGSKLKKDITKTAMRGKIHPEILKIITTGKEKSAPTEDIRKRVLEKYQEMFQKEVVARELLSRDVVMDELKKVTQMWRPFDETADANYTKYRHNSKELYADFFSALMTNPQFAKITAPTAYEGFFNFINSKPEFKKAYDNVQRELSGGGMLDVADARLREGFQKGEELFFERLDKNEAIFKGKGREFAKIMLDQYWYIISDVKNYKSSNIPDAKNPIFKIDEMRYQASEAEGYMNDMSTRVVDRMEKVNVSHEDLGMYLYYRRVVNERSKIANPAGFESTSAGKKMAEMEARTPELSEIANEYWNIRKEWVIDRLEQTNMYPKHLMDKIKDNDAYTKFDVVEYFDTHFGPGSGGRIFGQIGTLKDIANPFTSTMLNDMMLMRAASQNIALHTTIDFYRTANKTDPDVFAFEPAKKRFTGKFNEFLESSNPDMKLITIMRNGKMEGYYLDKYVAEAFEKNPLDGNAVINATRTFNNLIRTVLTDINPGFWMVNMIRDYNRTVKNIPAVGAEKYIPFLQHIRYFKTWREGFKPAYRSVYGIHDSTIKEMYKNNELISIEERGNDFKADTEAERLLKRHHQKPHVWEKEITMPLKWLYRHMTNMGQIIERQNKVAAHLYIKEKFPDMTPEMRGHMVRVQAGSPAFLRKGTGNPALNNIFMFSNAMKEGWRGDLEVMKDRPAEYMYKTMQANVIPKMIMWAMATGMMGDDAMTIMEGVSEYDKTNYIIIPIGLGKNGESIYFRIPQDETGRVFGGIAWKMFGQGKDQDVRTVIDYTAGNLPTLSPVLSAIGDTVDYMSGQMPYDSFRQRSAVNQTEWDAGFPHREQAMAGYMWNKLGGGIYRRYDTQNLEKIKSDIEELIHFPIMENTLGRFLKVSDYGTRQDIQNVTADLKQESAQQTLAANHAINQIALDPNYKFTDEEIQALAIKAPSLNTKTKRIFAEIYGNVFVQELMKAPSNAARVLMMERIREMAEKGNINAKEYLGIGEE